MPEEIPQINVEVCPSCRGAVGVNCDICTGSGVVRVVERPCPVCSDSRIRGMVRPGGPGTIAATCRRCNGTGRIRSEAPAPAAEPWRQAVGDLLNGFIENADLVRGVGTMPRV